MPELHALLHDPRWHRHWRGLLLALLIAVTVLALIPDPPTNGLPQGDKLNHLLAFGTLAAVASLSTREGWRRALTAAIGLLLYGGWIELVQTLLPWRSGEWLDLAADAVGIAIGLTAAALLRRKIPAHP